MNKPILMSLFLILAFFIQIPAASAWNWNTHQEIVENNYNSLPTDMKQNLNLEAMKDGSDDPDFKFFDFKNHSYPNSYGKAEEWLNRGQYYYKTGDYYYASYCYGVASHYIADSFCAPHDAGVSGPDHTLYEAQASFLRPEMINSNENLNSAMIEGVSSGKSDWNDWLKTKNNSDVQNDMNRATGASYNAIYNSISNAQPVEEKKPNNGSEFLMSLAFLI
ncbi:MAG TPA: zinc dependent phospholipase C family protein [Methanobacterium sp.]|nr:zinc dependent phospholipase C family protein [Methanobacterium sp.]